MNDYDDSEDYYSANSFRARSNTWPLNRPDLAVQNGVCIDETLPEIELEEDDLFTTNENWSTGLDHDIMSWDPILNAQSHLSQQHNPQQSTTQTANSHQQQQQQQQQHHLHHHHNPQQSTTPTANSHQQQQQPHLLHHTNQQHLQQQATTIHHHHQPHQQHQRQQQQPIHHQQQQPITQQQQQPQQHESILCGSSIILGGQMQQQPAQLPLQQHHQTLNNTQCLDPDDPNDYHVQQMHQLRLDNNPPQTDHQSHYMSPLGSMCIQGSSNALGTESYNISPDHHHLQPLTSARYDLDHQNDLDSLKLHDNDHQQHHHQQQQSHHHQLQHLTSTSLTDHSHMLSSSLSTSGIGLSGDLEDLDYKAVVDSSSVLLSNSTYFDDHQSHDDQDQQQNKLLQQGGSDSGGSGTKQSNSTSSSKTKLNTPRRNAWGNMSYADLISQAINSTNDKRLTLSQIYDWMVQHVPYFKDKGDSNSSAGWKNSVRHNLSLHNRFKRLQNEGTGKSSWWTINPEANIGKCARRRAASMEASKYEKKRGRAKKRADAIRQGLISYPSLTNSSLNGSNGNLETVQPQHQSTQFGLQTNGLDTDQNIHNRFILNPPLLCDRLCGE